MKKSNVKRMNGALAFALALATLLPETASAALGGLPTAPLFTTTQVKPNVIMAIDDSGSMDSEVLFATNDGALWWNTADQSFVDATGRVNFNSAGSANSTWKKYVYLFPNGQGAVSTGLRIYADADNDHYAIPPLPQYAFARSPDYNTAYFDPAVTYEPWVSYTAKTFGDISANSAPSDPVRGTFNFNLTAAIESNASNFTFRMHAGTVIPKGTRYYTGGQWKNATADVAINATSNVAISYNPAVYYRKTTAGSYRLSGGGTSYSCADAPQTTRYQLFHDAPGSFEGTGVDALGPDGACLKRYTVSTSEQQNFANWFSYYRKRHLAMRSGVGRAFNNLSGLRVGLFTINNRVNVTMYDFDTQRDTFYQTLYGFVGSGGTPNREAFKHIGDQYSRTNAGAPIIEPCQKCAGLLFTDGYATTANTGVGDTDGAAGAPYADSYANTLADIAMRYYDTDLRSDLSNKVPVHRDCPNARRDCNNRQHMNTYTVGLGMDGTIFGNGWESTEDAYDNPPTWPNVNLERNPTQIDDLYHAAVNGRGEMMSARTPSEIASAMEEALRHFVSGIGSGGTAAFNTAALTSNTRLYLAMFNSNNWSGQLLAYNLDANTGALGSRAWDAAEVLDARDVVGNPRVIYTKGATDGVLFTWDSLSSAQQQDLRTNANGTQSDVATGQARLAYIAGDRSNEGANGIKLRSRASRLGDIVYSSPVYVGEPSLWWPDRAPFPTSPTYSEFKAAQASRTPVIYAGGNDGMLHGFSASDGVEVMAYIPGSLYSASTGAGLHYLTEPAYTHRFYVDLAPTVSDVAIGGGWKTVLIGGLRGGGRGYFALDITNPSQFEATAARAAQTVMWEFTSANDADLGYSYATPTVALLNNGKWAAIFGNGYNDTGSGKAKLFILFLDEGLDGTWAAQDYVKIDTGTGSLADPNGLAAPAAVDVDGDGTVDRVYAGDLKGNLWAFDLSSSSDNHWSVVGSAPLFTTPTGRPITAMPEVVKNPKVKTSGTNAPNMLVMFGTGRYLVNDDLTDTSTQAFYSVWDNGQGQAPQSDLVEQTLSTSGQRRTVTDNAVDYAAGKRGCFLTLPEVGERSVFAPVARGEEVFFNTITPSMAACDAGGSSWQMSVAIENCGRPSSPVFDSDGNGVVDEGDVEGSEAPVGRKEDDLANAPVTVETDDGGVRYTLDTNGTDGGGGTGASGGSVLDLDRLKELPSALVGRLSWEEKVQ